RVPIDSSLRIRTAADAPKSSPLATSPTVRFGYSQPFGAIRRMTALPPITAIARTSLQVRVVPEAEVAKLYSCRLTRSPCPLGDAILASAGVTDISRRAPAVRVGCDSLHRHGRRQYGQSGRSRMSQVREESTCRRHFACRYRSRNLSTRFSRRHSFQR